jgi:lysophospholipase L1-like esterase
MLECLIIGDSIAVGTHQYRPECTAIAKGGINTWQWNRDYLKRDLTAKTVIISLGSNDHKGVRTKAELQRIREKVGTTARVFWVLPHGNLKASEVPIEHIQQIIKTIAQEYGDTVLPITRISKDNIHPSWAGYKELAEKTK